MHVSRAARIQVPRGTLGRLVENEVKMSPEGLARLEKREGVVATMYRDSAGLPTIGCGHLLTKDELSSGKLYLSSGPVDWHAGLTSAQITDLLTGDLIAAESVVNLALATVPRLEQVQFDSLVSFTFNVGGKAFRNSTLLKKILTGALEDVPAQIGRWVYAGGQVDPILEKRRKDEIAQWNGD